MQNLSDMETHIFDVEHGACSAVIAPSHELLMLSCGHNSTTGWRPSTWVSQRRLDVTCLSVENFDEDHVSDLPIMQRMCNIRSLSHNWKVDVDWLRRKKSETGIGTGIESLFSMMNSYNGPSLNTNWGGMTVRRFCHSHFDFQDTNSLSLVTFVQYGGVRMVFTGDLTKEAWKVYLSDPEFVSFLKTTNIFIASHHGRESGYCPDVFVFCKPELIIISDKQIDHQSQLVDYGRHASGIRFDDGSIRKVLTTRKDGKMTIRETAGNFRINIGEYAHVA